MKILKFKTNITSEEQLARVSSELDQENLISKWNLDVHDTNHLLSVSGEEITPETVSGIFRNKGFEAELIHIQAVSGHDL
jgi:copper chaperone